MGAQPRNVRFKKILDWLRQPRDWRRPFALYFVVLAVVGFWPTPVDKPVQGSIYGILGFLHRSGFPGWLEYDFIERSANVLLFVPLGILGALAYPARRWWLHTAVGLLTSVCIEAGQLAFFPHRYSSWIDIVTNTMGTLIGALAVVGYRRRKMR